MNHRTAILLLALALPVSAQAIDIEFQVPVALKNIDGAADYFYVDCAQWWPAERRRNAGARSPNVRLEGEFSKSYDGIVKVTQSWPSTIVPTGKYICTVIIRSDDYTDPPNRLELMSSAVGTRDVREIVGDYGELARGSALDKLKATKPTTVIPPQKAKPLPR